VLDGCPVVVPEIRLGTQEEMQRKVGELNGLAVANSEHYMEAILATPAKPVRHEPLHETQAPAPVGAGDTAQALGVQVRVCRCSLLRFVPVLLLFAYSCSETL
jgi:hypothetical protein